MSISTSQCPSPCPPPANTSLQKAILPVLETGNLWSVVSGMGGKKRKERKPWLKLLRNATGRKRRKKIKDSQRPNLLSGETFSCTEQTAKSEGFYILTLNCLNINQKPACKYSSLSIWYHQHWLLRRQRTHIIPPYFYFFLQIWAWNISNIQKSTKHGRIAIQLPTTQI